MNPAELPNQRYLWAIGSQSDQPAIGEVVVGRYRVLAPHLWQDLQPSLAPLFPPMLPESATPYLQLYPHRLHIPEVFGFCSLVEEVAGASPSIMLLENIPVDHAGNLCPALTEVWPQTPAVRQVYWLWQMLELWSPLASLGVATSLLHPELLRVEGWRVRLQELHPQGAETPSLTHLGQLWLSWCDTAQPTIARQLREICQQMGQKTLDDIRHALNQVLLQQAARLPIRLQVMGLSDCGPQRSRNEDSCYPTLADIQNPQAIDQQLLPNVAIVCDGIGGHEGGEVASQLAVRTLKLQIQSLLAEVRQATELLPPETIAQQIEAILRVINNLIAHQNDEQKREFRRRMGTTIVMAVQVPQAISLPPEITQEVVDLATIGNSHELYLAHVGDSRAYWITPRYCHRLTVDDDIASRDVRMGYGLYRESINRSDAGILTQAIGTKDSQFLHPTIQRFIIEEDGILLLCSDGLSDNDLVEQAWPHFAEGVLKGWLSLESAVQSLVDLANQRNGYDNTSVILTLCRISSSHYLDLEETPPVAEAVAKAMLPVLPPFQPIEPAVSAEPATQPIVRFWVWPILLLVLGAVGLAAWVQIEPQRFQPLRQQLPPPFDRLIPKRP